MLISQTIIAFEFNRVIVLMFIHITFYPIVDAVDFKWRANRPNLVASELQRYVKEVYEYS